MSDKADDLDAVLGELQVGNMLKETLADELRGTDEVADMTHTTLTGIPMTKPVPLESVYTGVPVEYLPNYAGIPELQILDTAGFKFDVFCAEREGIWLNTSELRVVTVRCGFALGLSGAFEAQIRPLPGLTEKGIIAQFGSVDAGDHSEVTVTLVNLSNNRQRIERGQRIARMVIVTTGITQRSDLVSVTGLVTD